MERLKNCDPTQPKIMPSAYSFFFSEKHSQLNVQHPYKESEYNKLIGNSWNKLTAQERQVYEDYASKARERFRKEMQEYRERLKLAEPREPGRDEETDGDRDGEKRSTALRREDRGSSSERDLRFCEECKQGQ